MKPSSLLRSLHRVGSFYSNPYAAKKSNSDRGIIRGLTPNYAPIASNESLSSQAWMRLGGATTMREGRGMPEQD
ncbi:hypothetical protein [Microcoleus sp. Aus8_D4]|uniref:hypothetical protein n=1 Tax=Microcoleus sp. Aus8_D4 TaxID=2818634 RepID=UPI002FD399D8